LVGDAIDRVPKLSYAAAYGKQAIRDKLIEHRQYINKHGDDMPEIRDWKWPHAGAVQSEAPKETKGSEVTGDQGVRSGAPG
jgi:xylulose-5-phosphate/fructose-6-phosphate phosphoketolase